MGTANFITQDRFDLYVTDYEAPSKNDLIEQGYTEEEAENYDYSFDLEIFYDDIQREFDILLPILEKKLRKPLQYHEVKLKGGYYSGVQLFVNETNENPHDLDNEDTHYYFGMCRSKAIKEYEADVQRVRKLMDMIAKELHFMRLGCVGVFSNGEAIYHIEKRY